MRILLFLCTLYCVQCNLLLSQVYGAIIDPSSQNKGATANENNPTAFPLDTDAGADAAENEGTTTAEFLIEDPSSDDQETLAIAGEEMPTIEESGPASTDMDLVTLADEILAQVAPNQTDEALPEKEAEIVENATESLVVADADPAISKETFGEEEEKLDPENVPNIEIEEKTQILDVDDKSRSISDQTPEKNEADTMTVVEKSHEMSDKPEVEEKREPIKINESKVTDSTTKDPESEEDDEDDDQDDPEGVNKFISDPSDITIEHIDFVQLRLAHIARRTSANITELRFLQQEEFKLNEIYKSGWTRAKELFDDKKKKQIFKSYSATSPVRTVPDEYHIALIAYTLGGPPMYADFNKKTREVCSGKDIDGYHYKSYFKLLLLAIDTLGEEMKFRNGNRFLYRGVSSKFALKVGQVLAFQHFQSTSSSLMVAEEFAGKTLFEIQGKFDTAISIRDHSQFKHEDEVLFSPLQVYEVESVHVGKYYTRYVLKAHAMLRSDPCDLNLGHKKEAPQQLRLQGEESTLSRNTYNRNSRYSYTISNAAAAATAFELIKFINIFVFWFCAILASYV